MNVQDIGTLNTLNIVIEKQKIQTPHHDALERFKLSAIEVQKSKKSIKKSDASYYP
ncbi:MAG: hypothetical protein U9R50_01475 [Campylobacterota bacterium]|nr:hypothetical protein [Campylobacterota bacterium]